MHLDLPVSELYVPHVHTLQPVAPVSLWYEPCGQSVQSCAPGTELYLPALQLRHSVADARFLVVEKVPTGHGVGVDDCTGQNEPMGQSVPAAPLPSMQYVPAEHAVGAEDPALHW